MTPSPAVTTLTPSVLVRARSASGSPSDEVAEGRHPGGLRATARSGCRPPAASRPPVVLGDHEGQRARPGVDVAGDERERRVVGIESDPAVRDGPVAVDVLGRVDARVRDRRDARRAWSTPSGCPAVVTVPNATVDRRVAPSGHRSRTSGATAAATAGASCAGTRRPPSRSGRRCRPARPRGRVAPVDDRSLVSVSVPLTVTSSASVTPAASLTVRLRSWVTLLGITMPGPSRRCSATTSRRP